MRLPLPGNDQWQPIREKEEQRRNLRNAAPGQFEEATDVANFGTLTARARSVRVQLCRARSRRLDQPRDYKNPAGEWCCGADDCGVVSPDAVKAGSGGYSLRGPVTYGMGVTGNEADGPTRQENVNEVVPYSQSLPSPDGAYWRCKRPDGTPRCFFAPPPGS